MNWMKWIYCYYLSKRTAVVLSIVTTVLLMPPKVILICLTFLSSSSLTTMPLLTVARANVRRSVCLWNITWSPWKEPVSQCWWYLFTTFYVPPIYEFHSNSSKQYSSKYWKPTISPLWIAIVVGASHANHLKTNIETSWHGLSGIQKGIYTCNSISFICPLYEDFLNSILCFST